MFKAHETKIEKKSFSDTGVPITISTAVRSDIYALRLIRQFGPRIANVTVQKDLRADEFVVGVLFKNGHRCVFKESEMFTPAMTAMLVMFHDLPSVEDV